MSQDVAENGTGTFRCRGEGIPEPTIKWLINGIPVTGEPISVHAHTGCVVSLCTNLSVLTFCLSPYTVTFVLIIHNLPSLFIHIMFMCMLNNCLEWNK